MIKRLFGWLIRWSYCEIGEIGHKMGEWTPIANMPSFLNAQCLRCGGWYIKPAMIDLSELRS